MRYICVGNGDKPTVGKVKYHDYSQRNKQRSKRGNRSNG